MSDTIMLIAGILLTSAGLLALLPYVLRRGWRGQLRAAVAESGVEAGLLSTETVVPAAHSVPEDSGEASSEELEELKAGLFSLRLMVGDALAEVRDAHELLTGEAPAEFSTDGV